MPIDTHQTYRRLLEAGVPEPQADVQARIFADWTEERLVTRDYLDTRLDAFETRLDAKITDVEHRMDVKIADVERRVIDKLTGRMITVAAAAATLTTTLLGLLITLLKFFG